MKELRLRDLENIINKSVKNRLIDSYRNIQNMDEGMNKNNLLQDLERSYRKELSKQDNELRQYRSDIYGLGSKAERVKYIMDVDKQHIREALIREFSDLFNAQSPSKQVDVGNTVYNEKLGINVAEEHNKELLREEIMSIQDNKKRVELIAANVELFS